MQKNTQLRMKVKENMRFFCLLSYVVLIFQVNSCVVPSGLGVGSGEIVPPAPGVINPLTYISLFDANNDFQDFEPAIEFRFSNWVVMGWVNALAPYDPISDLYYYPQSLSK